MAWVEEGPYSLFLCLILQSGYSLYEMLRDLSETCNLKHVKEIKSVIWQKLNYYLRMVFFLTLESVVSANMVSSFLR